MSHANIAKTFDTWAEQGDGDRLERSHGDVVAQVLASMEIKPGEKVLDLGCGTGWATRLLAKAAPGVQAIGIDVSPQMIARADELHSLTIRARYDLGTFEALEFADGNFDRAFSMEALYYSPDVDKAIAELFRVLKPGGVADVVIDFFQDSPGTARWAELMDMPLCSKSEAEWAAAFEAASKSCGWRSTRSPVTPCIPRWRTRAPSTWTSSTPSRHGARSTIWSVSPCRPSCGASCRAAVRPGGCSRSRCGSSVPARSRSRRSSRANTGPSCVCR